MPKPNVDSQSGTDSHYLQLGSQDIRHGIARKQSLSHTPTIWQLLNIAMLDTNVTLDKTGRILIPAGIRKALGLSTRTRLILRLRNDGLELLTAASAVEKAQALVRRHLPAKHKLVDDLIRSRRKEATSE